MTINPTDWSSSMIGMVSEERLNGSKFIDAAGEIGTNYGKFKQNSDGTVLFTPTTMQWNGFASFYALGRWGADKDTAITTGNNLWTRVNVIPANNVYYEDTFVTNEKAGIAGIVYGGKWEEVDEAGNQKEGGDGQGETAESGESTTENNQGGVHGWEDTLAGDTGYSDGSAHVTNESSATATFTFTGTGVDIYSRTNKKTGIVIAMLYKGDSTTDEEGNATIAEYSLIVDNLAASGDYYQVPTLSLFQIPEKDDDGNTVMTDLPHGTYTVKLVVTNADDSQTGEERFTYYLDGIRVYNPIQNLEGNDTVSDAYGEEELNATFVEIRDKLLDANAFSADTETSNGPVFIDRITSSEGDHTDNTQTVEIGTYEVFGPENEVYLSAGQMIAFAVEYQEGAHYYIGMKSLTGDTLGVEINNQAGISVAHTTDLYYEVTPVWTNSSGEGYTDANGNAIGYIIIEANADNRKAAVDESGNVILDESGNQTYVNTILALTKLKVTCPAATTFSFAMVRNADLLNYAEEVANTDAPDAEIPGEEAEPDATEPTEPSTPDDGAEEPETTDPTEPSTPDATEPTEPGTPDDGAEEPETTNPTEPSTPDVEIDNPETEPSTPDVEIENPETEDSEQDWQAVTQKLMLKMIKKIFSGLSSWFDR